MTFRRALYFPLAVLFGVNILNIIDRQALAALAEPIRIEFHLSDAQLGALTTSFTVLYALAGLPLGRFADRWSRKKLLAAAVVFWGALTAAGSLATSYAVLLVSRLGVAAGEAACAPVSTSWIGDLVPAGRRSRALAFFMLGVPLGLALSNAAGGGIAQRYGWRAALLLAALPALLLAPALLALREPARGAAEPETVPLSDGSAWALLRIPTFRWIAISGALVNFNLYALSAFLPAFMTRFHGLSVEQSGFWTGTGHAVAGVAGGVMAGALGDRVIHRRRNGRMLYASVAALLAAPLACLGILERQGAAARSLLLIMAAYGLLNMYYGLVYSAIQDIVPPSWRGRAMAIYFMVMYLCGASFGPLLTGGLSDYLAKNAAGSALITEAHRAGALRDSMLIIPVLSVLVGAALYAGSRTVSADMARRETGSLSN